MGKEHLNYVTCLNNIGTVYSRIGQYEKAIDYYQSALLINENILGKNHPGYANSLFNIGAVYSKMERYN